MTGYDTVMVGFIFIIGLLFNFAFSRRRSQSGLKAALGFVLVRYGLMFALGMLMIYLEDGNFFIYEREGYYIVAWDVIASLGAICLLMIPYVLLPWLWLRIALPIVLLLTYQGLLLFVPVWRDYAAFSVHGGIFGTLFVYLAATMLGALAFELLLVPLTDSRTDTRTRRRLLLVYAGCGAALALVGGLLTLAPNMIPCKRLSSLTWLLISVSSIIGVSAIFLAVDLLLQWPLRFLLAFGQNPFLLYLMIVILHNLLKFASDALQSSVFDICTSIGVGLSPPPAVLLYWRNITVDTLKVVIGGMAAIAIPCILRAAGVIKG